MQAQVRVTVGERSSGRPGEEMQFCAAAQETVFANKTRTAKTQDSTAQRSLFALFFNLCVTF